MWGEVAGQFRGSVGLVEQARRKESRADVGAGE